MPAPIRLENSRYLLEIDPQYGTLRRLADRVTGDEIIADPRLGGNFRLLLPLPDLACNYLDGAGQPLSGWEATPEGVRLWWQGPLTNARGAFDLAVTLWIELVGEAVQFRCEVRNGTGHTLTEVWYGIIGGMLGLGDADERRGTRAVLAIGNAAWDQPLFSDFVNTRGETLGTTGVEHTFCYPGMMPMPWISLYHPSLHRGLYYAILEETPRIKLIRLALDPGAAEGRLGGSFPYPEETGDFPTGATMNWAHVPFTPPGETFTGAPIVLQCHDGDWREAARLYRQWFDAHFPVTAPGNGWMRRETACLDTMFMLPEDNINFTYAQIPGWAQTARDRGVRHVMISGWHRGGHDRGYPYYEPDPRLGSWEELAAGIRAVHDLGMRVSFFVNCQPVDMTTAWYRDELHRYRVLDPHGVQYFISSWGMGTLSARTRYFTATPLSEMNPAHPEVRALLIRQFVRLVEAGADGLHIDKFFGTPLDFNPRLSWTSPDRAHHEGMLLFVEELLAACRAINPDFCFSYEGGWDRLFSYTDVGWWGGGEDLLKAAFPQRALTITVSQPYDYHRMNTATLVGSNILIGPGNYTRAMDYPPMQPLLAYVEEIQRIRQELARLVSFGEMLDRSEGLYRRPAPLLAFAGPLAESGSARWTVFRDPATGQRAAVLCNPTRDALRASDVRFTDTPGESCRIFQAFAPSRTAPLPVSLDIPKEQVVFIVED